MQGDEPEELLRDLDLALLPPAQGRRGQPLEFEVVRPLTQGELATIVASQALAPLQTLKRITNAHHRLAQLIAKGEADVNISLLTGYDPAYISRLKTDPAFLELITVYEGQRQLVFVDVLERMKALGLNSLEELQDRLEREPEKWTKRELMDLAAMCLAQPKDSKGASGGAAIHINVDFGGPPPQAASQVFDGKATRVGE